MNPPPHRVQKPQFVVLLSQLGQSASQRLASLWPTLLSYPPTLPRQKRGPHSLSLGYLSPSTLLFQPEGCVV